MDMTSISSNFSTNIKDLIPPGVAGRYKPLEFIFPDTEFNPQKMVNVKGNFLVLSKDKKSSYVFTHNEEKGFYFKKSALSDEMYFYPHVECTDVETKDGNAILLCYNKNNYNNHMSGIKIQYYIFVINLSTNKIIMSDNFFSQKIENPRLKVDNIIEMEDNYVIIIYPQLTKTLNRQRLRFEPKSRMIMIRVKRLTNKFKASVKWKIMDDFLINIESEVENTNKENVSLITFALKENGTIILHYGRLILSV
jgi:thiamine kinase-like enzyme